MKTIIVLTVLLMSGCSNFARDVGVGEVEQYCKVRFKFVDTVTNTDSSELVKVDQNCVVNFKNLAIPHESLGEAPAKPAQ